MTENEAPTAPPDVIAPVVPGTTHDDLVADNTRLLVENAQLLQAVESHAVIDQASGILMVTCQCSSRAAWELLVEISQHSNVKLRAVADALVDTVDGRSLPPEITHATRRGVARLRAERSSPS